MSEHDANARFARETIVEPAPISRARTHALELGAAPISPGIGAQYAVLAASVFHSGQLTVDDVKRELERVGMVIRR